MLSRLLAVLALCLATLAGCTDNALIRTEPTTCRQGVPEQIETACSTSMMEERDWPVTDRAGRIIQVSYILGIVEFDDQGKPYDPRQQTLLFDRMAREAQTQDLSIIVFVHGWKHNAATDDGNVKDFRKLLAAIAASEAQKDPQDRRRIIGIYTGWRGLSLQVPVVYNLSFWERKDAAQRVAEGAVRGLLGRTRAFRDTLDVQPGLPGSGRPLRGTRMLTIGHSFGGLIVYSALAQYFIDRAAISAVQGRYFDRPTAVDHQVEKADSREISSYGDLVLLINPAIEAMRYEPLRELVQEAEAPGGRSRYAPCQSPVLVQVTSEGEGTFDGDWATGVVFPIGRALNTGFEQTRVDPATGEDERQQIRTSMGHYRPFWTHDLDRDRPEATKDQRDPNLLEVDKAEDDRQFRRFIAESRSNGYLSRGWTRTYRSGALLTETGAGRYDPNNPFWVVRAHPNIILDHNDISAPVFVNFVGQLYEDLDRLKAAPECRVARRS